jgi:hypothetical protein
MLIDIAVAAAVAITPAGAGDVKLGKTFNELHAAGLIGGLRHGCELAGPSARSARLQSPLKGSVDFTMTSPRKAEAITVTGGGTARGVGVGSTSARVRAKFPRARFDHSTDSTFLLTIVRVPKSGGGKLEFAVSTRTHKVTLIGVPRIPFCE